MTEIFARFPVTLDVRIRLCEEADLPGLEWSAELVSHRAFVREQFERHLRGANVMLVAERVGAPVGQIWVELATGAADRVATLWAARVMPPLRGLGIGARLVLAGERVAGAAGRRRVELGVEKSTPRARRLYERLGYRYARDELSAETYAAPDGTTTRHAFDQWVLAKPLPGRVDEIRP